MTHETAIVLLVACVALALLAIVRSQDPDVE